MRLELLYNPLKLCERLAIAIQRHYRFSRLKGTVASALKLGHIDSLELLELLRTEPPAVVYDIGANVGTWTMLAKAVYPDSFIHAFEPLDCHVARFKVNAGFLPNVELHQVALGAQAGEQLMEIASFSDESSLLQSSSRPPYAASAQKVSIFRLDDYVLSKGLAWPDLLKLDVQGYELEVLKGCEKCLDAATAVITEVSFFEFYKGQCLFHQLIDFCAGKGFFLSAFGYSTPIGQHLRQTDVLFLKG